MPLQHIHRGHDNQNNDERIEPAGVHDALGLCPVSMDNVTEDEEGEVHEHTPQAEVVHPLNGGKLRALRPRKVLWQEAGLVDTQREEEKQENWGER